MAAVNYTGRSWTLELPPGTRLLSSNGSHRHWAAKQADVNRLRDAFHWLAKAQRVPPLQWAHVEYHVRARGRFDPANWMPTAKAGVDGIVRAGVLPDDNRKYLVGQDPREGMQMGFSLLILELAEAPGGDVRRGAP